MKLVLNDIKYLVLDNIYFYNDRIYYNINDFKMNGLYIKILKNMNENKDKYIVYLTPEIFKLNELIGIKYKSFIKDYNNPSIEVIKNKKTKEIFNNKSDYLILNFMSINDNNYPKIHILPCH
jgi:hypothetical protein